MITIIEAPTDLQVSKNPIYYQFLTDNPNATYIVAEVWVESEIYKDDFKKVDTLTVVPDKDGKGKIYLQETLNPLLQYELPEVPQSSQITVLKKTCLRYYLKYAEFTTTMGSFSNTPTKFVTKAGFHFAQFAQKKNSVMPSDRYWLTAQSYEREMTTDQYEFLYFLPPQTQTANFSIKTIGTDGQEDIVTIPVSMRRFEPFVFPCGYKHRFYNFSAKTIEITLFQTIRFKVKNRKNEPFLRYFFYFNSLGGLDSFATWGRSKEEVEGEQTEFQTYVPDKPKTTDAEFRKLEPDLRRKVKLFTGFKSRKEVAGFVDLINSTQVYELLDNEFIPISILTKKYEAEEDGEFLKFAELEYQYAFYENAMRPII